MSEETQVYDVVVVGGGPSGRIAALNLAQIGFKTALVAKSTQPEDGRTTALWQKSITLLREIGVWDAVEPGAEPLRKMRMIDGTGRLIRAPETLFDCSEIGEEEFGFNILNARMNEILRKACQGQKGLELVDDLATGASFSPDFAEIQTGKNGTIKGKLAIAADGRRSVLRQSAGIDVKRWSYPQVALVMNLDHTLPHNGISTEFHTPTGPFTLVPLPGRQSSLVCVETAEAALRLADLKKKDLELELERRAHSILGKFKLGSRPQTFPLSGMFAEKLVGTRLALIAETAHVFPPIGAQGLNLSMRDIDDLATTLAAARQRGQDIGSSEVLKTYETKRLPDIKTRTNAVDALNKSLLSEFLPVQLVRSAGMYAAGKLKFFRRILMREGMAPGASRFPGL